ncbi:hypothetical protein Rhe02_98420 [Rhizocola hellebori]|uniref:DUF2637 domain-containing protein n=1 Tax=Rhizocola hellebori TaxID=1392758 RepID=A0A8J3QJ16_9ACTN|nr:hypothetical protein [Rhizocola hellebori]GIH11775.1 hypothetical protein Rhe02_98420 [Rhizocola hellebori]
MTTHRIPGAPRPVRKPQAGQRFEDVVLVLILLAVGVAAGAGSFTHVHDWTMANSPAGKADWFGWANAVISELVPVAALLVIRRRKRAGQGIAYPAFLLVLALGLSITAQLAVAKPGFAGGLVSVVPALAFAALAKLILGKDPEPERPATLPTYIAPVAQEEPTHVEIAIPAVRDDHQPIPASVPTVNPTAAPLPTHLLDQARKAATDFMAENDRPITRDELRAVLRVSNATTGDIMRALGITEPSRQLVTVGTAVSPLTGKPLL